MALSSLASTLQHELNFKEDTELPETQIGNEGLTKRILKTGLSWQTPSPGDQVQVHFRGHVLDGASLESSHDHGTPFSFSLGQCEVIKGWDEGVATMRKGERAVFKIPPNLAYGEKGSPPLVPPNATLIFEIEMLSWITIRDLTGDGGILKKIIREGEGWETPRDADDVLVKYEAKLEDGMLSHESSEGVEFNISDGYLCPAMSIALKTMRKGEEAELILRLFYGLMQNSSRTSATSSSNQPDTNLTSIRLKLVSWKTVVDITGDKKILKKIVKAGEGFERPNEGSQVKVIYTSKLEDGTIIERKGSEEEPFEFTTQEELAPEGLEKTIMTMRKGEQATVTVMAEYLSDKNKFLTTPANHIVLYYEVQLVDFIKEKPFWKMNTQEKTEVCERKKHEGNLLFKAEKFRRASNKYEKALKCIEFDHSFNDDEKILANALRISCYLNNAACKLKLGEYVEASKLCTKVLKQDPLNVKALYRRCQAYLKTSELEKAEADIKRALTIDPNNRDMKVEYRELKLKQKEYSKYEADIFSTMLSRMA